MRLRLPHSCFYMFWFVLPTSCPYCLMSKCCEIVHPRSLNKRLFSSPHYIVLSPRPSPHRAIIQTGRKHRPMLDVQVVEESLPVAAQDSFVSVMASAWTTRQRIMSITRMSIIGDLVRTRHGSRPVAQASVWTLIQRIFMLGIPQEARQWGGVLMRLRIRTIAGTRGPH